MIRDLKQLFSEPSIEVRIQRELQQAEAKLLEAQSAKEYAAAMEQYHTERIKRLRSRKTALKKEAA